jgi:hypothetical protein
MIKLWSASADMTTSDDLFESPTSGSASEKRTRWRFVTNRPNLFYMLAAGLVMGPTGFGKKHFADALSLFPGWIPLFPEFVPKSLIEHAVSERSYLRPCIIEFDLAKMQGPCMAMHADGSLHELQFPAGLSGNEVALFVPAPLPTSMIVHIAFETKEDKAQALADAQDFDNVMLSGMRLKIERRAFSKATPGTWPPANVVLAPRDQAPSLALAAGGVMAMLLHVANHGKVAAHASRLVFEPESDNETPISDPVLKGLPDWIRGARPPSTADVSADLFWGLVNAIAACRFQDPPADPTGAVLDYLSAAAAGMDERMRNPLERLAGDLRGVMGLGDSTVTELLEKHPKPFSSAMVLFFLREKCADLLDFSHPLLREEHTLLAAILFGARCGWLGLPARLRNVPKLDAAVSHRMAVMDHAGTNSGLDLGLAPPRPRALLELLAVTGKDWTPKQKEAALILARAAGWDCIETRVTLGKGEYRTIVDGKGTHFVLAGEPKAVSVSTTVEMEPFFTQLTTATPPAQVERKVRALLDT